MYSIVCDGGRNRKNGGAYGSFKIYDGYSIDENKLLHHEKLLFGNFTSNEAEYLAMIESLNFAKKMGYKNIKIYSDSQLVLGQVFRGYMCNYEHLKEKRKIIWDLLDYFESSEGIKLDNKEIKRILGH
jgi:ribonuclease HI